MAHAQDQNTRQALTVISAAWLERGSDPNLAVSIIGSMADSISDKGLKEHLHLRKRRQEIVVELQRFVDQFRSQFSRLPSSIEQLEVVGLVGGGAEDPLQSVKFYIDQKGRVRFVQK